MNLVARVRDVGPIEVEIDAPPALVYQMLAAIGQGAQRAGERAEVVERSGDRLVADFWTRVALPLGRWRSVRTREAVLLVPPDRVEYEHLDGPIRGLRESIAVEPLGSRRARLVYAGRYQSRGAADALAFQLIAGPALERAVRDHVADLCGRAEARAARSRVFATPAVDVGTPAAQPSAPR